MKTARFVICQSCEEAYPAPQPGACPFCQDPEPDWQPFVPADEDVTHPDHLYAVIEGLLMLLEGRGEMTDRDGRLFGAVKDALVITSQMDPPSFTEWVTTDK